MAEQKSAGGVVYRKADATYFEKRGFRRYAGVWSLWALGVGAVISVTIRAGISGSPPAAGAACWWPDFSS